VQRDASGRYTLHELLRQYAQAELEAAGQSADACAAHCAYFSDFLQQREADLKSHRQATALNEIERDFENVRAAWQWAVAQRDYAAIGQALESLYWFCEMSSHFQDGLELLRSARRQLAPVANEEPQPEWGRVMARTLGQNSTHFEPLSESRAGVETGLAIAQKEENQPEIAFCLWRLASALYLSGDATGAIPYYEASLALYQELDDRFYQGYLLKDLGILYISLGQSDPGEKLVEKSLSFRRDAGDSLGIGNTLGAMGWIHYNRGRFTQAEAYWRETFRFRSTVRANHSLAGAHFDAAWLALFHHGDLESVRRLTEKVERAAITFAEPTCKHRTLVLLGFLAGMREEYDACYENFKQLGRLDFRYFPFTTSWEQMGLCLAACGLDNLLAAWQHLQTVLRIGLVHGWPTNIAKGLTFAAILLAKSGKSARATELLSLVLHHPLSPKGWLEQWPRIARLRGELEASLTPDAFANAWTRGAHMDLMTTAEAVMAEMERNSLSDSI
jgi:tetratricopeptide (TPR) repeat protein